MSEKQKDYELIQEARCGESKAFDALVLKYQYKVCRLISRYVTDPSEAYDVTQEVFIKVYQALDNFRGDSSFYTWLYRVAINTAKNYVVSQGRRLPSVDFDIEDFENYISRGQLKEESIPEQVMICTEMEDMLYDIIQELPSELRTAIMLRETRDLTYDEIAGIMGCPVGTVRSRIFRARETIGKRVPAVFAK